jgi:hypothetical protein
MMKRTVCLYFRITGEPLFIPHGNGLAYPDERLLYGAGTRSAGHSPTIIAGGVGGFDFHPHATDLSSFLSAAIGPHRHFPLHAGMAMHRDVSDDDNEDVDDEENESSADSPDGDEHSDGDVSSGDNLVE